MLKWVLATLTVVFLIVGFWYLFLNQPPTITTTTSTTIAGTTTTTVTEVLTMEYCNSFESGRKKDLCKVDLAIQENDESICGELIVYDAQLYCDAYFSGDSSLCEDIRGDETREECIQSIK